MNQRLIFMIRNDRMKEVFYIIGCVWICGWQEVLIFPNREIANSVWINNPLVVIILNQSDVIFISSDDGREVKAFNVPITIPYLRVQEIFIAT